MPTDTDSSPPASKRSSRPARRRRERAESKAVREPTSEAPRPRSDIPEPRWHTGPPPRLVQIELNENRIDPDAAKVVRRLTRHGYEAYLVGGCVRDLLVNRTPKDF